MPITTKTGDINGKCVWLTMQFNMGDDKSTQLTTCIRYWKIHKYTCKFEFSRYYDRCNG